MTDILIDGFTRWRHCPLFRIRQLTQIFFSQQIINKPRMNVNAKRKPLAALQFEMRK